MRLLALVFAWTLLFSVPALAQTPAGEQYDPNDPDENSGVGDRAAHDAIVASGALQASSGEDQASGENAASAAGSSASSGGKDGTEDSTGTQEENANTGHEDANADPEDANADPEDANAVHLEKLPETGGPSPLWFGVPLLCAGSLLTRRAFS